MLPSVHSMLESVLLPCRQTAGCYFLRPKEKREDYSPDIGLFVDTHL